MPVETLALPSNFDGQVRLFPLPDLVMFPNNVLPLHIFERRYREMLEDAMHGDRLIAMATLMPGSEEDYNGRPPIAPVVCVGRVVAHQKTEQDTYNLMLLGLQRARIAHEIESERSYRRARVTVIDNSSFDADDASRKLAAQLADRVRQLQPTADKVVEEFIQRKVSLAALTDALAFQLPFTLKLKLQLLAEPDVRARANLLLSNFPVPKIERRGIKGYPIDFSVN